MISSAAGAVRSEVCLALVETPHLLQGEVGRSDLLHGLLAVCNERSHDEVTSEYCHYNIPEFARMRSVEDIRLRMIMMLVFV